MNHTDRAHAVLAPSSMKRIFNCLASLIPLEHPIVEVESEYAKWGTKAHELFEQVMTIGDTAYSECDDQEMIDCVASFVDTIRKIKKAIGEKNIVKEMVETKVRLSEHIYGTLDYALLYIRNGEKRVYICDLKTGQGVAVSAERNEQLLTYLIALCKQEKWDAVKATISIYQPRIYGNASPLDQWLVEEKEMKSFHTSLKRVEKKALKVLNGDVIPDEVPGEHCRFCDRISVCRAYSRYASAPALIELDKADPLAVAIPEKGKKGKKRLPDPRELSEEQLSILLDKADDIRAFLKAVETYVSQKLVSGLDHPGWKLVEGTPKRQWLENTKEIITILQQHGVKKPYEVKLLGLGKIEKELGSKLSRELMPKLTRKGVATPKLVRESDKRPPLKGGGLSALTDLGEEDYE